MSLNATACSIYRGVNPFAPVPVIAFTLEVGDLADWPTGRLGRPYVEALLTDAPFLADRPAPDGRGGRLAAAMTEGAGLPLALLHANLAVALHRAVGAEVFYAATAPADVPSRIRTMFAFEDVEVAVRASGLARHMICRHLPATCGAVAEAPLNPERALQALHHVAAAVRLDDTTRAIVRAAAARDIPWFRPDDHGDVVQLGYGRYRRLVSGTTTEAASELACRNATDPMVLQRLLHARDVPVAHRVVTSRTTEALRTAEQLGYPVIAWPYAAGSEDTDGDADADATPVDGAEALRAAIARMGTADGDMLLRRAPEGRDYRLLVVDGDVVATAERAGPDAAATDVTDRLHPESRDIAVAAAAATGLDVVGIDLTATDLSLPRTESGILVRGVVPGPPLNVHWRSDDGGGTVTGRVVDRLFPPGAASRMPIAAVTGTSGKTTTVRMVADILARAGLSVGMANSFGIEIAGTRRAADDCAGFSGARAVLADPRVEAAVLETARGGIIRSGLAFDRCDVGAVLNVGHEHVGQDGVTSVDELAAVKGLVAEAAGRAVVLNADDPRCVAMAAVATAPVRFVSTTADNAVIAAHIGDGGAAALLRDTGGARRITLVDGGEETVLLNAGDIPATFGGVAVHMVRNAVFAAAIAREMGADDQAIRGGLGSFTCSIEESPGRMNVYDGHDFRVVLDWGINPYAVEVMRDVVSRLADGGRLICLMSFSGNRPDEDYRMVARLLAGRFDHIVCSDKRDELTRPPGEAPRLFYDELRRCGMPEEKLTIASDQSGGVTAALSRANAGDCVWLSTDAFADVWQQIVDFRPARPAASQGSAPGAADPDPAP